MTSTSIALTSASCIYTGALLGMGLQRLLPNHHLSKETQDVVKLSAGTIATLTALVLGLLVSSAKSSFDTMNTGIVQSSAKIILLDRALETKVTREQLKRSISASLEAVRPKQRSGEPALTALERADVMDLVQDSLRELTPQTDGQRRALAQAQQIVGDLHQAHWLLFEQEQNELPLPSS